MSFVHIFIFEGISTSSEMGLHNFFEGISKSSEICSHIYFQRQVRLVYIIPFEGISTSSEISSRNVSLELIERLTKKTDPALAGKGDLEEEFSIRDS